MPKLHNIPPRKYAIVIMLAILALMAMSLASCSCEWHMNRAEKKCGKTVQDTLLVRDTFITKEVQKDTVFKYLQKDTVIVRHENMTLKYYYNSHDSTVYLSGKCAADTIYKEKKVPYEKTIIQYDWVGEHKWWLLAGIILLMLGLVYILKK